VVIINLAQLQAENSDITMPPSVASFAAACKQKRESRPDGRLSIRAEKSAVLVAGIGLCLQVMSLTSYRAALSRANKKRLYNLILNPKQEI
jgi:hypothetical protein